MKRILALTLLLSGLGVQILNAQITQVTSAILDSAASYRSVKYADATYQVARRATEGEGVAVEFAIFNADSSRSTPTGAFTVSRGFLMFDLTDFKEAQSVDSARLYMRIKGTGIIDPKDEDSTHVVEGTYTGGYAADDSVAVIWYNDFTGWVDLTAEPADSTWSGVVEYTAVFTQDTLDSGWQNRLFTAAGLDSLQAKLGNDTLRMVLLNGQDISNITPTVSTDQLTSWYTNNATYLPYVVIYYNAMVYDSVASAVSGSLLLSADSTVDDNVVHDSTLASSTDTTDFTVGYWRSPAGPQYKHIERTALTFTTDRLEMADSVISASLFIYPTAINDSLDLVAVEGTFSDTIGIDWFNDYTGWVDGSASTVVAFTDSMRIEAADTSSWVELELNADGMAALVLAMGADSLRIMLLSSDDVNREYFETDSAGKATISAAEATRPYLRIGYTTLSPPGVITNIDVDTTFFVGSNVYAILGGRIDSVGDGLDSVGFRYYIKGNSGGALYTVSDSASATWATDSFYLNTSTADTLTIDTLYVITAFAVHGSHRLYSTVNDTISTEYAISTLWETFSTLTEDSVIANPVRAIWPDAIDRLWFGTAMGLYRQASDTTIGRYLYGDSSFTQKSRNNILSGAGLPDSTIYTGSPVGLSKHEHLSFTTSSLITETSIPDSLVWYIFPDSGGANQIWAAGNGYLWRYTSSLQATFTTDSGLVGPVVYDIVVDSALSMWVATGDGVSRVIGSYWISYTSANSGLLGDEIYTMAILGTDSSLWFGSDDGLVQFDGDTTWTDWSDSLSDRHVKDLAYDNVNLVLWIATDSGLTAYQPNTPNDIHWRQYYAGSTSDSLPRDRLFSVLPDTAGRVWIGHSTGITRLTETY